MNEKAAAEEAGVNIGRLVPSDSFHRPGDPLYDPHAHAVVHLRQEAVIQAMRQRGGALINIAEEAAIALQAMGKAGPPIVCLCGSTRFWKTFQEAGLQETLAGKIVLSIGAARCADDDDKSFGGYVPAGEFDQVKARLDELHLRKIELADEVLVLNVGGYIGESTGRELAHARKLGKVVRFLEPDKAPEETA